MPRYFIDLSAEQALRGRAQDTELAADATHEALADLLCRLVRNALNKHDKPRH